MTAFLQFLIPAPTWVYLYYVTFCFLAILPFSYLFLFLVVMCGDLSSLTRDQTQTLDSESAVLATGPPAKFPLHCFLMLLSPCLCSTRYITFSLVFFPSTDMEVTQPISVILVVIVSVLHYSLISVTGTGHFLNTTGSYACIPLPSVVGGLGLGFLWHPLSRLGGPQADHVIRAQEEGRRAFLGGEGTKMGWRGHS